MSKRLVSVQVARDLLWGAREAPGLIEETIGFKPATAGLKNVHFMNDLAQTVLGGCPPDGGDLLCKVIREGVSKDEDNSEESLRADMRFGVAFSRAYPVALGAAQVKRLRLGARALLNVDQGMYAPGIQMASSVATHRALLGADGFRRFRMGAYLASVLDDDAKARFRNLYESDADPVSLALKPLFQRGDLQTGGGARVVGRHSKTQFDADLGKALAQVLRQPLSKPTVLRAFALASCLGFILKVFGAGMREGRPVLLALGGDEDGGPRPLREKAVISMRRGGAELDRRLAQLVAAAKDAKHLWHEPKTSEANVEIKDGAPDEMALELIERLHEFRAEEDDDVKQMYWPQDAVTSLGRRAGIIQPRVNHAGWGSYLALTSEAVEVVSLMLLPWGERADWRAFWTDARARLGIVIGANDDEDMHVLKTAGVLNVSLEDLSENSKSILAQAVRRGVARLLPDSGTEIGGYEE